ncbi:hypothetical protein [uncultured Wocania sp.]|uniref:hypothetical protein n=1 Tax=uncultured Wocania sp. TaxID=2834404 RepID=UPI0030F987B0
MKKLSYIVLGFLIGAFATYYFCPRDLGEGVVDVEIIKPRGVIAPGQAKKLNDNWTEYREAAVDSAAKKQGRNKDDRSTWWSLNDIENYIAYSKHVTDSLKYDMTGIRVYLGVYGDNAGQTKKNLTTMFLVPTVKKGKANASMNPFNFSFQNNGDCPECPPLNEGSGGGSGYPK